MSLEQAVVISGKPDEKDIRLLSKLAVEYGTDKGPNAHNYTAIYAPFFAPLRSHTVQILEIGVQRGASLKLWYHYFPKAHVYGLDKRDCVVYSNERISCFRVDQTDRKRLGKVLKQIDQKFDIIIDDGGHFMEQQQISLGVLFPYLKDNGFYIIEDLHTSLRHPGQYGIKGDRSNTTLRMLLSFNRRGKMMSVYLSKKERAYLDEYLRFAGIFLESTSSASNHITALLSKKDLRNDVRLQAIQDHLVPFDFDAETYIRNYADLRQHGITSVEQAFAHYFTSGKNKGRSYKIVTA